MSYLRDRAIVLKNEPFREHDCWLTLYGFTYGKLIAVARGVRRLDAKHLGHVEPFTEIEVMIAQGQAFDKLAVATTVQTRLHLRERLGSLVIGGAITSLVERLTQPGSSDPVLYALLQELLDFVEKLPTEPTPERARLLIAASTLRLLDLLGYALQLEACLFCQQPLIEPVWFVPPSGGMACEGCMRDKRRELPQAVALPPQTIRLLRFVRQTDLTTISRVTVSTVLLYAMCQVVDRWVEHHAPFVSRQVRHYDPVSLLQVL